MIRVRLVDTPNLCFDALIRACISFRDDAQGHGGGGTDICLIARRVSLVVKACLPGMWIDKMVLHTNMSHRHGNANSSGMSCLLCFPTGLPGIECTWLCFKCDFMHRSYQCHIWWKSHFLLIFTAGNAWSGIFSCRIMSASTNIGLINSLYHFKIWVCFWVLYFTLCCWFAVLIFLPGSRGHYQI